MAEFDGETANLDLFHESFSLNYPGEETVQFVRIDANVGKLNVNKHSFGNNLFKKTVINNDLDNGILSQADSVEECLNGSSNKVHINEHLNKRTDLPKPALIKSVSDNTEIHNTGDDHHIGLNEVANSSENSCVKPKKGVSFPKDALISSFLEPPDPWKNAPTWTTEELVSAYKECCETQGTKPLTKIVQQLQNLHSPGKREDLLNLKGEKLDQKQCECLEEILKRVQFSALDLEASQLDDECAVALFDMVEYYESSCQLNIAYNKKIQARGWQACSRLVRRTPSLTCLDIKGCDLNDRTIPIFGRALKLGCHLTVLHMENMNLSGRALLILVAALKMNDTLQELFLADNKLMPSDGVQLGSLLQHNHKLSLLDLRNNHLQDVGTGHICDGLKEQPKGSGLRTLVLWNNTVNYQAMSSLGRALATSDNLETLNIGHNSITNEGVHLLKDGLLRVNSLLRLGLQGAKISDEGAVALAEYIADTTALLRIDLRENDIKTGGLMALSHAMRINTSITRIDLDKEPKKEAGMKDYVQQQSRLLADIFNFQQRNIEAALSKEKEERLKQEEKACVESDDSKKGAENELPASGTLPPNSSEPFAFIAEELGKNTDQEKDKKDAENIILKINGDMQTGTLTYSADLTDVDNSDLGHKKEDPRPHIRPNVLCHYPGLAPQTSLDSPVTSSEDVSPCTSEISTTFFQSDPSGEKAHSLAVSSAPAEMILSPQYFPKQIARKIFSVSRVDDTDLSSDQLSTSPSSSGSLCAEFDPLNVSPVPLVPISATSLPPPSSYSLMLPHLVEEASHHSQPIVRDSVSPCSSLFDSLIEESFNHLVASDIGIDEKSVTMVKDADLHKEESLVKKCSDEIKVIIAAIEPLSFSSQSSNSYTGLPSQRIHSAENALPLMLNCTDGSTVSESALADKKTSTATTALSVSKENPAVVHSKEAISATAHFYKTAPAGSPILKSKGTTEKTPADVSQENPSSVCISSQSEFDAKLTFESKQIGNKRNSFDGNDILNTIPDTELPKKGTRKECDKDIDIPKADTLNKTNPGKSLLKDDTSKECDTDSRSPRGVILMECSADTVPKEDTLIEYYADTVLPEANTMEESNKSHPESTGNSFGSFDLLGADREQMLSRGGHQNSANEKYASNTSNICNTNTKTAFHTSDKHSLFTTSNLNTGDMESVFFDNLCSSSLLDSELPGELSSIRSEENSDACPFVSSDNEELSFTSLDDDIAGHREDTNFCDVSSSVKESDKKMTDSSYGLISVNDNSLTDNIVIENVDFSLDEEPWLAVGAETDGNEAETSNKPDFFTTLSMNVLTQELASALTSFDGSPPTGGSEDCDIGELQPHDKFERELDAMLALVQSELPWPLQGSRRLDP